MRVRHQEQLAAAAAEMGGRTEPSAAEPPEDGNVADQHEGDSRSAATVLSAKIAELEMLAARVPELEATIAELQPVKVRHQRLQMSTFLLCPSIHLLQGALTTQNSG